MAHANNSIITGKFKGSLGKELVSREWQGKTVVAKSPKARTGDPTLVQAELQEKFLVASRYAKAVTNSADQTLAQGYASALRPRQNVYSRALEDFMSPPIVKLIDTRGYKGAVGDRIVTRAVDENTFRISVNALQPASEGYVVTSNTESENACLHWYFMYLVTKIVI